MAENDDKSREDLSDEASPYKLEEYRNKGMVSQSRELTGLVAMLAAAVALYSTAPQMGSQIADLMREVFRTDLSSRLDLSNLSILGNLFTKAGKVTLSVLIPVCLAGLFLGVGSSFAQIGSIFSFDPITPNFEKLDPIKGLKKLISLSHFYEGLRLTLKTAVTAYIFFSVIRSEVYISNAHFFENPGGFLSQYAASGKKMFLSIFGALLVFSMIDFFLQRWEFGKNVRLTKQEAKQEYKEREGDPQIKARVRSVQRDIARRRMMAAVKKADVIITNPTHIAIALAYDKDKMAAPRVVAKGADFIAQKIKKIALDAGIPLVENVPLARTLFKTVKMGQVIPKALYQAVAEVLAYVYRLKNKRM